MVEISLLPGKDLAPGNLSRPSTLKSLASSQHACPVCPHLPVCLPSACEVPRSTCSLYVLLELVRKTRQEPTDNTWALQLCSEMGRGRWPRGVDVRNVSPGMRAATCLIGAACTASPGACGPETSRPCGR